MDFLSLGLGVAGAAMSAYGAYESSRAAKSYSDTVNPLYSARASTSQDIAAQEQKIQEQNFNFMKLSTQRQQLENLRKAQQARAQATAAGFEQGAERGSGLAGGLAQIEGNKNFNALGFSNSLEIGTNIFGFNSAISADKMRMAGLEGQLNQAEATYKSKNAEAQGWTQVGNSLGNMAGPISRLSSPWGDGTRTTMSGGYFNPGGYGFVG